MDRTIRALTDLCTVDDQLSEKEALLGGLTHAFEERRAALREAIPGAFLAADDALGRVGRRPVIVPVRDALRRLPPAPPAEGGFFDPPTPITLLLPPLSSLALLG
jgi:hypothetical protein